jgi:hypothetical protein
VQAMESLSSGASLIQEMLETLKAARDRAQEDKKANSTDLDLYIHYLGVRSADLMSNGNLHAVKPKNRISTNYERDWIWEMRYWLETKQEKGKAFRAKNAEIEDLVKYRDYVCNGTTSVEEKLKFFRIYTPEFATVQPSSSNMFRYLKTLFDNQIAAGSLSYMDLRPSIYQYASWMRTRFLTENKQHKPHKISAQLETIPPLFSKECTILQNIEARSKEHLLFSIVWQTVRALEPAVQKHQAIYQDDLFLQMLLKCFHRVLQEFNKVEYTLINTQSYITDETTQWHTFCDWYEFIHDFSFVFLSYLKPYSLDEYTHALTQQAKQYIEAQAKEFFSDPKIQIQSYPARSGMDAFCVALMGAHQDYLAMKTICSSQRIYPHLLTPSDIYMNESVTYTYTHNDYGFDLPPYFEFSKLLGCLSSPMREKAVTSTELLQPYVESCTMHPNGHVFTREQGAEKWEASFSKLMAKDSLTINTNQPIFLLGTTTESIGESNPTKRAKLATAAAQSIQQRMKEAKDTYAFSTLLLDTTLEFDDTIGYAILAELRKEILDGTLNVILMKSHQKFAALGSGKFKSGSITVLNNGDPKFAPSSTYIGNLSKEVSEECPGEIQLMTHWLTHCSTAENTFRNASKANATQLQTLLEAYKNMRNQSPILKKTDYCLYNKNNQGDLITRAGIAKADTFAFARTTETSGRISVGLEPAPVLQSMALNMVLAGLSDANFK